MSEWRQDVVCSSFPLSSASVLKVFPNKIVKYIYYLIKIQSIIRLNYSIYPHRLNSDVFIRVENVLKNITKFLKLKRFLLF